MAVNCRKCKYFFVTWENERPYGCRAFGFKSKKIPSMEVFESSGKDCLKYTPQKEKPPKDDSSSGSTHDGFIDKKI